MHINSVNQNTVGNFNFRANQNEYSNRKIEDDSSKTTTTKSVHGSEELTVITPVEWQEIEFEIARIVDHKSNELQEGLEKIFREGNENVLSGKSGLEYDKHIKELAAAIEGQDYKNAEKIIDRFYTGDKDEIIGHVQNLANFVKDSFWKEMRDSFKNMCVAEHRTTYEKGEDPDQALPYVLRAIERAKAASSEYDISDKDLAERVTSTISTGAEDSKRKLKNAGRNRYSETSESVTHATAQYVRNNIFGGDENSRAEDKVNKDAAYEKINSEFPSLSKRTVDKLNRANKNKKDNFSKYLFKSGEAYFDALKSELGTKKLASKSYTTVEKEQNFQNYRKSQQKQQALPGSSGLVPMPVELTIKVQDSTTQQAFYSPLKITELYGNEEDQLFGSKLRNQLNGFSGWT